MAAPSGVAAAKVLARAMRPFYGAEFLDSVVAAAVDALVEAGLLADNTKCNATDCGKTPGHMGPHRA